MIPGKLYRYVTYGTPLFENIKFWFSKTTSPSDGSQYYLFNPLKYIDTDTIFMVIENINCFCKGLDANGNIGYIPYNKGDLFKDDCFCKVLDANGNIGYIRYNKGDSPLLPLFKEVKE